MPSKLDKYEQKNWLVVDKDRKYLFNGLPYLKKDKTHPASERVVDHVIIQLIQPFLDKERNVTTDNYFTSVTLTTQLKQKQTSFLGTVKKIRREVPLSLRKPLSLYFSKLYKFVDITLTVYQERRTIMY